MISTLMPYFRLILLLSFPLSLIFCGKKENSINDSINLSFLKTSLSCEGLKTFYNLCDALKKLKLIKENQFITQPYNPQQISRLVKASQIEDSPFNNIKMETFFKLKTLLIGGADDELTETELDHLINYLFFFEEFIQASGIEKETSFLWNHWHETVSISDFESKLSDENTLKTLNHLVIKTLNQIKKHHKTATPSSYLKRIKIFIDEHKHELNDLIESNFPLSWQKIIQHFPTQNEIELSVSILETLENDKRYFQSLEEIFLNTSPEEREDFVRRALELFFLWEKLSRYVLSVEINFRSKKWDLENPLNYKKSESENATMIDFFEQLESIIEEIYKIAKTSLLQKNRKTLSFNNQQITRVMESIFKILYEEDLSLNEEEKTLSENQRELLSLTSQSNQVQISEEGRKWIESWTKIPIPFYLIDEDDLQNYVQNYEGQKLGLMNEFGILQLEALKKAFNRWYYMQKIINHFSSKELPLLPLLDETLLLNETLLPENLPSDMSFTDDNIENIWEFLSTLESSYCPDPDISFLYIPSCKKLHFAIQKIRNSQTVARVIHIVNAFNFAALPNGKINFSSSTGFSYSLRDLSFLNFYRSIISIFSNMDQEYFHKKTTNGRTTNVLGFFLRHPQHQHNTQINGPRLPGPGLEFCKLRSLLLLNQTENEDTESLDCSENYEVGSLSYLSLLTEEKDLLPNFYSALTKYVDLFLPASNGDNKISIAEATQFIFYLYSAHAQSKILKSRCRETKGTLQDCTVDEMNFAFWENISKTSNEDENIGGINKFLEDLKENRNDFRFDWLKYRMHQVDSYNLFKLLLEKLIEPETSSPSKFNEVNLFVGLYFLETFFKKWDQHTLPLTTNCLNSQLKACPNDQPAVCSDGQPKVHQNDPHTVCPDDQIMVCSNGQPMVCPGDEQINLIPEFQTVLLETAQFSSKLTSSLDCLELSPERLNRVTKVISILTTPEQTSAAAPPCTTKLECLENLLEPFTEENVIRSVLENTPLDRLGILEIGSMISQSCERDELLSQL